ncbi:MAG: hypothetical protein HYV29_12795 [Ignavibacteriales bacterium]|nr:hypothetical protein [Ignavibacteriales bacterium]
MKKAFTIVFLLLYATLNVGVNILVHTCGGESETLLVTSDAKDPCVCDNETPMDDMCCTTELKSVKFEDVQQIPHVPLEQSLTLVGILPPVEISTFDIHRSLFVILSDSSPPPDKDYQVSNSVFLI